MKKTISICFFAVCLLVTIYGALMFSKPSQKEINEAELAGEVPEELAATELPESTESMTIQKPFRYVLREQDGILVVYEGDGVTILLETDIEVMHLDETTKALLLEGIYVQDEKELYDLLESYSS